MTGNTDGRRRQPTGSRPSSTPTTSTSSSGLSIRARIVTLLLVWTAGAIVGAGGMLLAVVGRVA